MQKLTNAGIDAYSKKKRAVYTAKLAALCTFTPLFAVGAALLFNYRTPFFICIIGAIASSVFLAVLLVKEPPSIIYSGNYFGIITKAHVEEKVRITPTRSVRYKMVAYICIKREDGKQVTIKGISPDQANFYRPNDRVYRFASTRFPLSLDDKTLRTICPVCGTIFPDEELSCTYCGTENTHIPKIAD